MGPMTETDGREAADQEERTARRQRRRGEAGFTLLELLVVMTILGLLAAVAGVLVIGQFTKAQTDAAALQINSISAGLDLFYLDHGRYPSEDEGLKALVEAPADSDSWRGPYLKDEKAITDPWKRVFLYRYPGQHGKYDLYSLGADNAEGGQDDDSDVTNW